MAYVTCVAGTVITASWANQNVRDQTVTPHATSATRLATITSPVEGMVSYTIDDKRFDGYNGTGWYPITMGTPMCLMRATAAQTLNTSTWTPLDFDTEDKDTMGAHSTSSNISRFTPTIPGYFAMITQLIFEPFASGAHGLAFTMNGSANYRYNKVQGPPGGGRDAVMTSALLPFNGTTDYCQATAIQSSGSSLLTNVNEDGTPGSNTTFAAWYVRAL